MTETKQDTYGAITRTTEPWPWKRFFQLTTFSSAEFAQRGPKIVVEKGQALLQALIEWDKERHV